MKNGKIVQVMGPVIDVEFEDELPKIKDALEVELDGKKLVMEVSQHIGGNCVRCIMLAASEGLCKDMEVINTGDAIKVPVGDKTLGRLFNVVGETIDGLDSLDKEEHWAIHRKPPTFEEQSANVEILETGIKVIDLLTPYPKGGKIGLFGGAGVGKPYLFKSLLLTLPLNTAAIQYSPVSVKEAVRVTIYGKKWAKAAYLKKLRLYSVR